MIRESRFRCLQKPCVATITRAMAKTRHERDEDAGEGRLEHIREQISSGDLGVRQMTASERRHWDERSATLPDRQATPDERTRRDAARKKRNRSNRDA